MIALIEKCLILARTLDI